MDGIPLPFLTCELPATHYNVIMAIFLLLTFTFGINFQVGAGSRWLTNPIIGDTLEVAVVSVGTHRLYTQHGTVGHVDDEEPVSVRTDPLAIPPPVNIGQGISRCLAEEADDPIVDHSLVFWSMCDPRWICKAKRKPRVSVIVYHFAPTAVPHTGETQ